MSKKRKKKKSKKVQQSWCHVNFADSFDMVRKVNKEIPDFDFDCKNCKNNCCVSPLVSIVEFVYVVRYILKNLFNKKRRTFTFSFLLVQI